MGFAIPSNLAKGIVEQLILNGYVRGRAVMGVQVGTMDDGGIQRVYVETVNSGSAAEKAGVKPGDIILSANGTAVSTVQELKSIISAMAPGDKLDLKVKRDGGEITLSVVLDESKPTDQANMSPPYQTYPNNGKQRNPNRQPQNPDQQQPADPYQQQPQYPNQQQPADPYQQQPQNPNQQQPADPNRQRQYSELPFDFWDMFPGMDEILPQ
jgi:hypothetical protein